MTVWLTSDTHFGHKRLAEEYRVGPFSPNVHSHAEWLTTIWNERVKPEDTVYHLGDFAMGPTDKHQQYFDALHGTIHLIRGNHDGKLGRPYNVIQGFASVEDSHFMWVSKVGIYMLHYPCLTWPGANNKVVHAHGHSHGGLVSTVQQPRLDVGIDAVGQWNPRYAWGPVPIEEFVAEATSHTYTGVDHH